MNTTTRVIATHETSKGTFIYRKTGFCGTQVEFYNASGSFSHLAATGTPESVKKVWEDITHE